MFRIPGKYIDKDNDGEGQGQLTSVQVHTQISFFVFFFSTINHILRLSCENQVIMCLDIDCEAPPGLKLSANIKLRLGFIIPYHTRCEYCSSKLTMV